MANKPSAEELKKNLSEMQFYVTQNHGTEPPFTGRLLHNKRDGVYHCLICDAPLFHSQTKYDSGCGWPSFYEPVSAVTAMPIWAMSFLTGRSQRANVIVLTLLLYASLMAKTAKKSTVEKTIQQLIPQERKNYES